MILIIRNSAIYIADLIPRKGGQIEAGKLCLLLALLVLFVLTLSRPYVALSGSFTHDEASSIRQWAYVALVALTATSALIDRGISRSVPIPIPIVLVLTWCWFSLSWSSTPSASLSRLVLTTIVIWTAFVCVDRLGVRRSVFAMRAILGAVVICNYVTVALHPSVGIHDADIVLAQHQWRGAMSHKNIAGTASALAVLVFVFHGAPASRLPRYIFALIAAIFMGFTQSRTSIVGTVIAIIAAALILCFGETIGRQTKARLLWTRRVGLVILALVTTVLLTLTMKSDVLLSIVSDPTFLSGRGQIWQPMLLSYLDHPAFGTGYGAFWVPSQNTASIARDTSLLNGVTQGHNGYLDFAIQVGLSGLLLSLFAVVAWPASTIMRAVNANREATALATAIITFFLVNNLTETSLFDSDQIPQVFAMVALALLASIIRRRTSILVPRRSRKTAIRSYA